MDLISEASVCGLGSGLDPSLRPPTLRRLRVHLVGLYSPPATHPGKFLLHLGDSQRRLPNPPLNPTATAIGVGFGYRRVALTVVGLPDGRWSATLPY